MADIVSIPISIVNDICTTVFKICTLLVGMTVVYLGYKLFLNNVIGEAGDFEGGYKNYKFILKKAVPGTYFIVFGSLIIVSSIFKGIHLHSEVETTTTNAPTAQSPTSEKIIDLPLEPPKE